MEGTEPYTAYLYFLLNKISPFPLEEIKKIHVGLKTSFISFNGGFVFKFLHNVLSRIVFASENFLLFDKMPEKKL